MKPVQTIMLFALASVFISCEMGFAQPGGRGFGGRQNGPTERMEPNELPIEYGIAKIPDRAMYEKLSYKGPDVMRDGYLANLQFVKFFIENPKSESTNVYFMNTKKYRAHPPFMRMVGVSTRGAVRGAITYLPRLKAPDGDPGLYIIDFEPNDSYSFDDIKYIFETLTAKMPILKGKVAFHPLRGNQARYESEKEKYAAGNIAVHTDADLYGNIAYLPLNEAASFGRLRVMENDARPAPRDIVIYKTLPNQMPRVAGVITEVRQTPLSHVNLRAVQDKIPNAFIDDALNRKQIKPLIGKLVHFNVTDRGFTIREATTEEVANHFASLRPSKPLSPVRDLSVKAIRPLSEIKFEDSSSVGVKSANLAAMHQFNLPAETVPDGFAIPFYFYDEFMKHNNFYELAASISNSNDEDRESVRSKLADFRTKIESGEMPEWMMQELSKIQKAFPAGKPIRCRSSTNNEDLPGFSGAGLYDSFTHNPDEGHLAKSVKQVFASLWNFRAFDERKFYRVEHDKTAMGVLLTLNQKNEQANGVAVTDDILYETDGNYYLNTQIGEDLVTNPEEGSSPEEILLGWWSQDGHEVVRRSIQAKEGSLLLNDSHLTEMRKHLAKIHGKFAKLYGKVEEDQFAMEIEFKITENGKLLIKQARPWVY